MIELAHDVGKSADVESFRDMVSASHRAFQQSLFMTKPGLYRDGVGTNHSSLHANLFPLAFGLVPAENRHHIVEWLVKRGMQCSVYAAQYLLEGLFEYGAGEAALELMTAPGDRSWRHMVESGATITWEAWDMKYKPNQDWSHAWGAAPANLLRALFSGHNRSSQGGKPRVSGPRQASWSTQKGKSQHHAVLFLSTGAMMTFLLWPLPCPRV
jgi:hypothetical protein